MTAKTSLKILLIMVPITVCLALVVRLIQYKIDAGTAKASKGFSINQETGEIIIKKGLKIPDDIPVGEYSLYHTDGCHGVLFIRHPKGGIRCIYGIHDFFDDFEDGDTVKLSTGETIIFSGVSGIILKPVDTQEP